jgi:hypothetical protein
MHEKFNPSHSIESIASFAVCGISGRRTSHCAMEPSFSAARFFYSTVPHFMLHKHVPTLKVYLSDDSAASSAISCPDCPVDPGFQSQPRPPKRERSSGFYLNGLPKNPSISLIATFCIMTSRNGQISTKVSDL